MQKKSKDQILVTDLDLIVKFVKDTHCSAAKAILREFEDQDFIQAEENKHRLGVVESRAKMLEKMWKRKIKVLAQVCMGLEEFLGKSKKKDSNLAYLLNLMQQELRGCWCEVTDEKGERIEEECVP